jgi:hypothetical protein
MLVQLIQDDVGNDVALQLDDDPHSVLVGFVVDPVDALDLLLGRQLGDGLDQIFLVDLIGNLGHHDLGAAASLPFLYLGPGPHHHPAASCLVSLLDPFPAIDVRAGGEVGTLDRFPQLADGGIGVIHQQVHRFYYLAQIVWWDVGGHADGDAARPVDQQVGNLGGKDGRFLEPVVEVRLEVDGVSLDVLQHRRRDAGETSLGIAICRRRVAVDRAEVPLPVHQGVAEREVLHHPHQRVVHRAVAMWVVLAENVTDYGGGLLIPAARYEAQFVHGIEDPAMDRLEPVTNIGQRPRNDDAHRIVDERLLHLLFDEPGQNTFARVGCGHGIPVLGL